MKNWSVDLKKLKKNKEAYKIFRLEQLINFGLGNEKINLSELKKYLPKLHLDKHKKKYAKFLLSQ